MNNIIFLATYLRSGSTWLRFLLTNLLSNRVESSAQIDELIPEIPELGSIFRPLPTDRSLIVKTHLPLSAALLRGRNVSGAIYLVRNPLDVTVSLANFYLRGLQTVERRSEEEIERMRQQLMEHMLNWGTVPACFRDGVGTWSNHVASWLCDTPIKLPVLIIRYEDLLRDPARELARICESISLNVNESRIMEAVERSSWSEMKRLEEREIEMRTPGIFFNDVVSGGVQKGFRFLYRGTSDTALELLSADQIRRGVATFSPLLQWLEYDSPSTPE